MKSPCIHVEKRQVQQVLSEFKRVLKPNGHVFLGIVEGDYEEFIPEPLDKTRQNYFQYYQTPFLEAELKRAGFSVLKTRSHPFEDEYEKHLEVFIWAKKESEGGLSVGGPTVRVGPPR